MTQIDILPNREALRVFVGEDGVARGLRFADDMGGAGVVQEAVVDTTGVPRSDAVRASKGFVPHERVSAAIVRARVVVSSVVVFLFPRDPSA